MKHFFRPSCSGMLAWRPNFTARALAAMERSWATGTTRMTTGQFFLLLSLMSCFQLSCTESRQHTVDTCGSGDTNMFDLWETNATYDGPAGYMANSKSCNQLHQDVCLNLSFSPIYLYLHPSPHLAVCFTLCFGLQGVNGTCVYEPIILKQRVETLIRQQAAKEQEQAAFDPLFIFWSMHLVHMPLEVPTSYLNKFSFIKDRYSFLFISKKLIFCLFLKLFVFIELSTQASRHG